MLGVLGILMGTEGMMGVLGGHWEFCVILGVFFLEVTLGILLLYP